MTIIDPQTSFNKQRDINCEEAMKLLNSYGMKFWSWGAHGFRNCYNKALRFRVRGHHHKGWVYLSVNGMDLYDYHLTNLNNEVIHSGTDMYNDQIFDVLDELIEKIPAYKW